MELCIRERFGALRLFECSFIQIWSLSALFGQNLCRMCSHAYYFILTIFVSPALDVTNLFSHKLAYQVLFKMADDCRKFYDISEQLNAIDK